MRFSASVIAALAFILNAGTASAQTARPAVPGMELPSDAQIKAAMKQQRSASSADNLQMPTTKATQDFINAQRQALKDSGVVGVGSAPPRIQPVPAGTFKANIPVAPATAPGAKRDNLDELVKRYNAGVSGEIPAELAKKGDVVIFVSFSMPKSILADLSRQAKEAGAVMVVRGMKDGSVNKTREAMAEVDAGGVEWEIHPDLFKTFKVTKVPTFVVANAKSGSLDEEGCAPEATYSAVTGNVSVELALDTIRRRAAPAIANLAGQRLDEMHKRNAQKALR